MVARRSFPTAALARVSTRSVPPQARLAALAASLELQRQGSGFTTRSLSSPQMLIWATSGGWTFTTVAICSAELRMVGVPTQCPLRRGPRRLRRQPPRRLLRLVGGLTRPHAGGAAHLRADGVPRGVVLEEVSAAQSLVSVVAKIGMGPPAAWLDRDASSRIRFGTISASHETGHTMLPQC